MNGVYKLKFSKSSFELNDDYEILSEHEKEKISDLNAETFFDYDDDYDSYICYVIASAHEIKNYLNILNRNLIDCDCEDLSKSILKQKINLEKELKPFTTSTTKIKYSFFIDELNEWIYENLDIDTILDRISEIGSFDLLTNIEKDFLKSYKI